jgi:hypothetical protein
MSYHVVKNSRGLYEIFEKSSKNTIEVLRQKETHTRTICKKLNLGYGFDGWTPNFLAKSNLNPHH